MEFTYGLVDFLAVSEKKVDSCFPKGQFKAHDLGHPIDKYRGNYENMTILGDFNMQPADEILKTFLKDNKFE